MEVNKMESNLKFLQDGCTIREFKSWCHKDTWWKSSVLKQIIKSQPTSVLDVGCGTAHFGELLRDISPKIKYLGIEYTPKFIDFNKSRGFNCEFGDARSLSVPDNSYDCVLCLDLVNYFKDYKLILKESIRASKKTIIVSFFKRWGNGDYRKRDDKTGLYEHFIDLEDFFGSLPDLNVRPVYAEGEKRGHGGPRFIVLQKLETKNFKLEQK